MFYVNEMASEHIQRHQFLPHSEEWFPDNYVSLVETACYLVSQHREPHISDEWGCNKNVFLTEHDFYRKGFVFFINLDFGGAHEAFLRCLGESDASFLYSEELLLWASWHAEDSLTCIPVSSAVLRVYLCLLFGSSEIEAVIFLNARPHGFYLGFPHISVGNCEIHLQHRGATGYQFSA